MPAASPPARGRLLLVTAPGVSQLRSDRVGVPSQVPAGGDQLGLNQPGPVPLQYGAGRDAERQGELAGGECGHSCDGRAAISRLALVVRLVRDIWVVAVFRVVRVRAWIGAVGEPQRARRPASWSAPDPTGHGTLAGFHGGCRCGWCVSRCWETGCGCETCVRVRAKSPYVELVADR